MSSEQLRDSLQRIHEELAQGPSVNPEVRELLVRIMADIDLLLAEGQSEPPQTKDSLIHRLRESIQHFEDSHPALVSLVGKVADGLSNIGV